MAGTHNQHHSQTSNRNSCLNFTEDASFSQNLAYLSKSNIALNQQVSVKCDLLRKNEFSIQSPVVSTVFVAANDTLPVCANDSIISVNQGPKNNENAQFELAVIGILYRSHARSELTPTLKVILAILTNLCRRSRNGIISYQTSELFQRCFYLFNESQAVSDQNFFTFSKIAYPNF